jgi:hypothetical protein
MQTSFIEMDNTGRAPVFTGIVGTPTQRSNTTSSAMEQLMATTASLHSLLTVLVAAESEPYNPEMVSLLLELKRRGPVERFRNADAALKRLLPAKG